jgi:hypothetical protein
MPTPITPRKISTKKTPEKIADLGQQLARRKSQDFKSKIQGWNEAGAGVAQEHNEIVVIEAAEDDVDAAEGAVEVAVESDNHEKDANDADVNDGEAKGVEKDGTPPTPKAPGGGAKTPTKQTAQRKTSREVDSGRKAWVRRKSKPSIGEASPEVKQASVPKTRVVSDGHWRRDRVAKDTATPEKEKEKEKQKDTTPKPITIRRSVVSVGLKAPPSFAEFKEEVEPAKRRALPRRTRSRSRSREREDEKESTPDYESSGTKVYIKRRRRSKTLDRHAVSASESSLTVSSSCDRPSSATEITTPDVSPKVDHPPRPSTAPKERLSSSLMRDGLNRRSSKTNAAEDEPVSRRVSRKNAKDDDLKLRASTPKAAIDSSPREVASAPKVFGNRIEGWLSGVGDDPFTENADPSLAPEPLKLSKRRSRPAETNDHDEYEEVRRSSTRRHRNRPSLEPMDTNQQSWSASGMRSSIDNWADSSPATNTPTLKRSGARRTPNSPVKERTIGDTSAEPDLDIHGQRHASNNLRDRGSPSAGNHLSSASADRSHSRPLPARARAPSNSSEQLTIVEGSVLSRASDGDEPRYSTGLKRRLTKHSDLMSVLSLAREDDQKITSARSIRTRRVRDETATTADIMNEISTDELKYQRELRTLVDGVIPVLLTYVLSKDDSKRTPGSRSSSMKDNAALTQPIYQMGVALERLKAAHKRIPMHDPNEFLLWAQSSMRVYSDYLKVWRLGFEDIVVNLAPADESEKHPPGQRQPSAQQGDGERVDVAYLLKRPLVRMKTLSKTLRGLCQVKPSTLAEDTTATYIDMVAEARRRVGDEKARLEDESAAAIDPTRARDPRHLALLGGVHIDPMRSVRARDFFDMELYHSSGQQLDCKIELIRRDNAPSLPGLGDVLFCEVATTGKWLLFPPVLASTVSAREGDNPDEMLVMVRGELLATGGEWREIMILRASEDQVSEWIKILGSDPMPPRLTRQSSFNTFRRHASTRTQEAPPSPTESEVPFGERAKSTAPKWDGSDVNSIIDDLPPPRVERTRAKRYRSTPSSPLTRDDNHIGPERNRYGANSGYGSGPEYGQSRGHTRSKTEWQSDHDASAPKKEYSVWLPSSRRGSDEESADEEDRPKRRPTMHRRMSSVPSAAMPTIPKLRQSSPSTPVHTEPGSPQRPNEPGSAPSKLTKQRPVSSDGWKNSSIKNTTPLPKKETKPAALRPVSIPSFTPEFLKKHRRSSSPLKHEYAPSTASESSSESDFSDVEDEESVTSESDADEAVSTVGDLQNFAKFGTQRPASRQAPKSTASVDIDTLGPSDSPSQAAYRTVPPTTNGAAKSVACIFSWSEGGTWDSLHPEECEIVVTPGLIEAFDIGQANAVSSGMADPDEPSPSTKGVRPLVALELTPLVPLRRGTALDISIRSPPTQNSLLRKGNNLMFRSRSPEDCEKLYAMINRARIDNPTWIALQNARGPVPTSNWAEVMDRRNASRSDNPSWIKSLSRKGSTYRSKGPRSASIAASQSSVGTMSSAISALRRFSGGNIFNIAKSTINSKQSTRSSYSDSLSSGAATPIPIDPSMGTPVGITNAKVRFYARETESKWRDMGAARLTIMLPPRPQTFNPADLNAMGLTKRVLVVGKSKGETLFDETLSESAFERIQRTGIAVTVWQELRGPNGELGHAAATGGVGSRRTRTYLIQMKSVSSTLHVFYRNTWLTWTFVGTRSCVHFQHGRQTALLALYIHLPLWVTISFYDWCGLEAPSARCMYDL